jgi:hypothetical protein
MMKGTNFNTIIEDIEFHYFTLSLNSAQVGPRLNVYHNNY